jgi:nucleoside-triphosphatase THEP1
MDNSIKNIIKTIFTNLNSNDIEKLTDSSIELIEEISIQLYNGEFNSTNREFNFTCLKSIILLLLPYISNFNFSDLNEIIYIDSKTNIDLVINKKLCNLENIKKVFPYSTIGIELLNNDLNINFNTADKLIYKIIDTNLYYLKKTLQQINCKMYSNWTTIVPIIDYKKSNIYKNTNDKLNDYLLNKITNYNGLSIDTFYDTFINGYYNDIKNIKFLIYVYKLDKYIYVIQYLNKLLDLDTILKYDSWDKLNNSQQIIFKNKCISIILQNNNELIIWKEIFNFIEVNKKYNMEKLDTPVEDNYNLLKHIKKPELFWFFLKSILEKFKLTIYSKYLITNNEINNEYLYYHGNLHLKNIYNVCKSLKFIRDSETKIFDNYYKNLSESDQKLFCNRFNNNIPFIKWVNIKSNYKRENFKDITYPEYDIYIDSIKDDWNEIKNDLVWKYLSHFGLLTEFKLDKINVHDYVNCNYYLNNAPYSIEFLNNLKNVKWYTLDSFHWIFQINFFMHYIFTDLHYVTGSTGTGKSTQTPKLYLYALKMIDYKINGQILCSEPRIEPTRNNAKRISEELGFGIFKNDDDKTENFAIQYEYAMDKHTSNFKMLNLKLVTDGLLLIRILDNQNFDIIIIDEAHEHNSNMDLLLTFCKFLYTYKKFKIVIISATMDNDEPTYRRYFKEIKISNPDLIYLDKRMNISIFANETLYPIKEYYRPNKTPLEIIKEILNNTTEGEILLFQNGRKDIMNMVNQINSSTPANIIALPYLGELDQNYKNIIINIHEEKSKLKIKKTDVEKWINNEIISDISYSYSRCIIVATNIAEASITLASLKFVIDNGKYNEITYDYDTNSIQFKVADISEQSRIQRKGRVGRVSEGNVYYLYEKDSKKNIKNRYNITKEDFTLKLIQFLDTKVKLIDEEVSIFSLKNLLDVSGELYLVHPFEHFLNRNLFLQVDKELDMNLFLPMLRNLGFQYLYVNMNPKFYFENVTVKNNLDTFSKTELFDLVKALIPKFSPDISEFSHIITLIYAINYGIFKQVLFIIIALRNPSIFHLFKINYNHITHIYNIFNDLEKNNLFTEDKKTQITEWCSKRIGIKYSYLIINLIKKYNTLLSKLTININEVKNELNLNISKHCTLQNILKCFSFGYFKNIGFKINDNYVTVDGLLTQIKQNKSNSIQEYSIILYFQRNDEIVKPSIYPEINMINEISYKILLENPMVFNNKTLKTYHQPFTSVFTANNKINSNKIKTINNDKYGGSWDLIKMQIVNNFKYDYVFKTEILNKFLNNIYRYIS